MTYRILKFSKITVTCCCFFFQQLVFSQDWNVLDDLSRSAISAGETGQAIYYGEQAITKAITQFGENSKNLAISLFRTALAHQMNDNYSQAQYYYLWSLRIQQGQSVDQTYFNTLKNLANLYVNVRKFDSSEVLHQEMLDIVNTQLGDTAPVYAVYLNNLGTMYSDAEAFDLAKKYYELALENKKMNGKEKDVTYAKTLTYLAVVQKKLGQFESAEGLFQNALELLNQLEGTNNADYAYGLNGLAGLYEQMGVYARADKLFAEALQIRQAMLGKDDPLCAETMNNMAGLYLKIGEFAKAISLYQQALEIARLHFGNNDARVGSTLNNLAYVFYLAGEYDRSGLFYKEVLKIEQEAGSVNSMSHATTLNNLGMLYSASGKTKAAISSYTASLEIMKIQVGEMHPHFAATLSNLAESYEADGQYQQAEKYFLKALDIYRQVFGEWHRDYATILNNLAGLYMRDNQPDRSEPLVAQSAAILYDHLSKAFAFLSEAGKQKFSETVSGDIGFYQQFYCDNYKRNPALAGSAFDLELATKGMILQADIQMRLALLNKGDSALLRKFDDWVSARSEISRQNSLPVADRSRDLQEMEEVAESLEKELVQQSAAFGQTAKPGSVKWQSIRSKLRGNEVAVEFSAVKNSDKGQGPGNTRYIALVLRQESPYPQLVTLCEQRQLDSLFSRHENADAGFIRNLYRGGETIISNNTAGAGLGKELYKLIWEPLDQFLKPGDKVYFSPSGSLHQVAFAALHYDSLARLSDRYTLEQLSTTAMLLRPLKMLEKRPSDMTLFGGMEYDRRDLPVVVRKDTLVVGSIPEDVKRGDGNWKYLPGTLNEVQEIEKLARMQKVHVVLYTGENGTEINFKKLYGSNSPRVLHIATHGFYLPDPYGILDKQTASLEEDKNVYRRSADPLNRSGLLFTGANRYWLGAKLSPGNEDGILTAYEATGVLLEHTQLVVLSACETGLGDIKGSEGVFGLQRAFKAAGAEYLIMSLWKVPDAETAEFMKRFYTGWFGGKDIPDAFRSAQTEMKIKYPNDPYKWAAFVLVR